jgi:hypothetical protein
MNTKPCMNRQANTLSKTGMKKSTNEQLNSFFLPG